MQATAFLFGAALAALPLLPAIAASADAGDTTARPVYVQVAQTCPPGTHWANAGYAEHGKWRPAHCARDDGTD